MILDLIHQRNNMKIKRFNESEAYDLSFDGFKEVMSELTDDLDCEFEFSEENERTDELLSKYDDMNLSHWYECLITLKRPEFPVLEGSLQLKYDFLAERQSGIPFIEEPEEVKGGDIRRWIQMISDENSKILDMKSNIDEQIRKNNEIRNILVALSKIQIRLKSYDNYKECKIGFDSSNHVLSISFELK